MGVIYLNRLVLKNLKGYITLGKGKFSGTKFTHIKLNNEILYEFNKPIKFTQFQVSYWLWLINDNYSGLYPIFELRDSNMNIVLSIGYFPWQATYYINNICLGRNPGLYGQNKWIYCSNYFHDGYINNYMDNGGINRSYSYSNPEVKYISIGGVGHMESWGSDGHTTGYNLCKTDDIIFYYNEDCNNSRILSPSTYYPENYYSLNLYRDGNEIYGMK